jgi:hypothetical protein
MEKNIDFVRIYKEIDLLINQTNNYKLSNQLLNKS